MSMAFPPHLAAYNVPYSLWLKHSLLPALKPHHQDTTVVATGALVFKYGGDDNVDRVLLVRRAATDSMPNRWEIPGGGCDVEDSSILHSLAREVKEESGMNISRVVDWVDGSEYDPASGGIKTIGSEWDSMYLNDKVTKGHGDFFTTSTKKLKIVKLTFWVEVEELEGDGDGLVKLDPEEHSAFAWVTAEDIVTGKNYELTTMAQMRVILRGFEMVKERRIRAD